MSKINVSNSLIIDDYKNYSKEEYTNIAKQNEENFKTKKFEKFIPRNSKIESTNILTGEENKLKSMLFSILKNQENQNIKTGKSPNNYNKNKFFNSSGTSSIKDENKIKKYKQFKRNPRSLKVNIFHKTKKRKSDVENLDSKLISQNFYPNLCMTPQQDVKRCLSFENKKSQKELQKMNSSMSKSKKSRNSINSFNKNEKIYNSEENQSSTKSLKFSYRNTFEKKSDKLTVFSNKDGKNCININKSKEGEVLKNICTFGNKNEEKNNVNKSKVKKFNSICTFKKNEEKNKMNTRNFSIKNIKNFMAENDNVLRKKVRKSVSITAGSINAIKNSLANNSKSDKNINQLKISNMKIFRINKEKIRKSLGIIHDEQKNELKHSESSGFTSRKDRPKMPESLNILPQRFSSTKQSINNLKNKLLQNNKKEEFNKKETLTKKSTKFMTLIDEKFRHLIHKGIIYDSLDDEESEFEEMASYNFYIDPNSKFCFIFDLILFFLTLYTSLTIPLFLAKNLRVCKGVYFSFFHLFNCLSEICNVIDTILGFFRAYYNYDEQLIKKSKLMIKHYVNTWFLIDLISSIPFYTIFNSYEPKCTDTGENSTKYYSAEMHNLHYLFLCIKMIKSFKVFKNNRGYKQICRMLKHHLIFKEKGALIARTYMTILIFHFGACVHIFIGRNSYPNWILSMKMESNGFLQIYLSAVYCLTMTITTVGYGDVTCYSFNETIFQIVLLIFGIFAYSWIVSSISSYIEKNSNDLNHFEQKIDILNDIKLHHPNMSEKLYNKIMQHLIYRNSNEKNNKNLIFDCLPLSLKNNLIFEMYKPIITKFIFFKNIDNVDFIVKVVLAFRPVIAVKNDIIVNQGDIVEEIAFVKKGVLIVQLLINIEKNKDNSHLINLNNKSNLEKTYLSDKTSNDNSLIEKSANHDKKTSLHNNSLIERLANNVKKHSLNNNSLIEKSFINEKKTPLNNNSLIDISFKFNTAKDISYEDINKKYIKIIYIRENEHFGDVLMFSGQRSPMRLMVRSTKAELFILKKEDVVKISYAYSNIWRRINEKSVYNFEQMKKSIHKIVKVLSPQTLNTTILDLEQKNIEKKDSKNNIENKNENKMITSSFFTDSEKKDSEIEKTKEEENKNKDTGKKESIKDQIKQDSTLILSSQYSNLQSENNLKSKNKLESFVKSKKETPDKLNQNKRHYSVQTPVNKNKHRLRLNTNSIINSNINIRNNQRSATTTPFRKEEVNQEIYADEKFELTNVDEYSDNLFSKREICSNLIKNINNIDDNNSKQEITNGIKIVNNINTINIISNINNNKNNNIISKGDNFSIKSSYENFNELSKDILIYNENLQKKMKNYLKKQINRRKLTQSIIKIQKLNLDFLKANDGKLANNSNKKTKISNNKKESLALNNISFDSKNYSNNNFSVNLTSFKKNNSFKQNNNENSFEDTSNKKITSKASSNKSLAKVTLDRKLSVNSSFRPVNKSVRNLGNKLNKSITKVNKSNNNLLTLINGNINDVTENLIEPEKFYRRYFNELINSSPVNRKGRNANKPRNNFSTFAEEYKCLSPKVKSKRFKSCSKNNI